MDFWIKYSFYLKQKITKMAIYWLKFCHVDKTLNPVYINDCYLYVFVLFQCYFCIYDLHCTLYSKLFLTSFHIVLTECKLIYFILNCAFFILSPVLFSINYLYLHKNIICWLGWPSVLGMEGGKRTIWQKLIY